MTAALNVFWDHALVGRLGLDDHGDMNFSYASGWLEDPSPAFPLLAAGAAVVFSRRSASPPGVGACEKSKAMRSAAKGSAKGLATDTARWARWLLIMV